MFRSTNALAATPASVTFSDVSPTGSSIGQLRGLAVTAQTITVGADGGSLKRSEDGGASWATYTPSGRRILAVAQSEAGTSWTATEGGRIYQQVPASSVTDYAAGAWGNVAQPGLFGVCVQAATGTADWPVDTGGVAGTCEAIDADAWHAVPTAPTKVAHTTSSGQAGSMTFVWGMRPAGNQSPGNYAATVIFEALAPNV
jgi:hypothetical protein